MQITAIILAGGKSKRMGTDKALLELGGISLLEKVISVCEAVCNQILISSNNFEHAVFGYPVIEDEIKNCGPIGGLYSCLKKTTTNWNFVISVDSPFVEKDYINFLNSEKGDFDAIVPVHSKGKEPLIAFYHKSCISEIEKRIQSGNFKMYDLVASLNTKLVDSEKWLSKYPKLFQNINRPEDLQLNNE